MAEFEYENFTLKIDHDANGYVANVLASPVGQASERFNMPKLDDDLSAVFQELETTRNTSNLTRDASGQLDSQFQQGAIKALGEKLFSVVFGGEIGTAYQRSLDSVKTKGKGLRIQLRTSHSLSEIPWEYLRDPQGPGRFLFHSEQQSLSRYLELPVGIQAFSLKPPLRILVMISNPSNARSLNVELEWEKLNSAFKNLKEENLVDIKRIPATLEDLQAVLKQQGCHIFHFIGHGGFDAQHGGVLLMEDDQRKARKVDAETIASQLQDIPTLQLVVLNACKGARATLSNPFAGIAQTLVAGSVPAVVAMQYPISDEVAITFAKRFYGSLARAAPVDTAIAQARKAIFALEFGKFEFGIPVLYTRSPDGHIFDVQGGDQAIDPFKILGSVPDTSCVDTTWIQRELIQEYATHSTEAPFILAEANAMRLEFRGKATHEQITLNTNYLPSPLVPPMQYWRDVFHQACLKGPKTVAALLLALPENNFSPKAKKLREHWFKHLVNGTATEYQPLRN